MSDKPPSPILQRLIASLTDWIPMKAVFNWPTPKIEDEIVSEMVDGQNAQYVPLTYGVRYNDHHSAPYARSLPNHVLVFQATEDASARWIKRIWASNRVDQNSYNYSIEYPDGDPEFPRYTRVYVLPRAGYEPLAPLSDDPIDPNAKLVSEQLINEVQPPELNSLYVKVARVYETLPGAITTSYDYDTELNINVITTRQVVPSYVIPLADPPVLNVPVETPLTLELRETPRTKYTKVRIISALPELPAARTEFNTGRYPFPSLLLGITLNTVLLTEDPDTGATRSEVRYTPDLRPAPDVPAKFRITTTFHTSLPSADPIYVLLKKNVLFRGISYQFNFSNVLTDAISVGSGFSDDSRYGDMSEAFSITATTPSATEYLISVAGTYQVVGVDIKQWRGQIWVRSTTEVLLI